MEVQGTCYHLIGPVTTRGCFANILQPISTSTGRQDSIHINLILHISSSEENKTKSHNRLFPPIPETFSATKQPVNHAPIAGANMMWSHPYQKPDVEAGVAPRYPVMLEPLHLRWAFIRKVYSHHFCSVAGRHRRPSHRRFGSSGTAEGWPCIYWS